MDMRLEFIHKLITEGLQEKEKYTPIGYYLEIEDVHIDLKVKSCVIDEHINDGRILVVLLDGGNLIINGNSIVRLVDQPRWRWRKTNVDYEWCLEILQERYDGVPKLQGYIYKQAEIVE